MIYLGGALGVNTFLMYGFFNTVPMAIDEAAKIDGAGHAQVFFTIMLPLVVPILGRRTAGVHRHLRRVRDRDRSADRPRIADPRGRAVLVRGPGAQNWGIFAAGAVLAAMPVMVLFLFLQRYIAGGLIAGSVKG